jgi:formylglycine-generating enzyme required for sulfatase activity
MKRIALIALLLAGILGVAWIVTGLPPVRMVWRYGFSYHPEPTGTVETYGGVDFVEIGPGCFLMGSDQNAEDGDQPEPCDEMPLHWVEFRRGFWVAKTEITNEQYEMFDPEHKRFERSQGDRTPVMDVSWEDAKKYCAWLSRQSGQAIRLPSESEWECACRAGSDRRFCFGDDEKGLLEYAWCDENSHGIPQEVGTRRANAWGLHDFHGNVSEWCEDSYHSNYEGAPADGTAWTEGGVELEPGRPHRVIRGGGSHFLAEWCRSADRIGIDVLNRGSIVGFRPAFRAAEK